MIMKQCLHCGKQLRDDTTKCIFCGNMADQIPQVEEQKSRSAVMLDKYKDILFAIILLIICFIVFMAKK
jgi:uncharacterized membrane protein YvbJ